MAYSVVMELEDGGTVSYDNVVSCTIEEQTSVEIELEDPNDEGEDVDDTEEEGEPERGAEEEIPLNEVEEETA